MFLISLVEIVHVENEIRGVILVSRRQVEQIRDGWREQLGIPLFFIDSGATEEEEEEEEKKEEENNKTRKIGIVTCEHHFQRIDIVVNKKRSLFYNAAYVSNINISETLICKSNPITGLRDSGGWEFLNFQTVWTWRMQDFSPTHQQLLPTRRHPWYSSLLEVESAPGT